MLPYHKTPLRQAVTATNSSV